VPGFAELKLPNIVYPLRLLLTPYANEITLRKYLGKEDKENELRQLLQQSWQSLADTYCDREGVNILMAHLYFMQKDGVPPEEPDDEKPILHMGGAQAIYTDLIPAQIQYTALGHLHRHQLISEKPCPVVYSSSPLAYSFSEADQQKYVVLIEAEPGQAVQVNPVPLYQGRTLLRKRFTAVEEAVQWLSQHPDTYVELTLVSDTYIESKVKKVLYETHDGIVSIIPEITGEQHKEDRGQSKMDLNKNIREIFKDYIHQKKGQQPNEELMALFNEILDTDTSSE
jgi:exonuclease SbcD